MTLDEDVALAQRLVVTGFGAGAAMHLVPAPVPGPGPGHVVV